MQAEKLRLQLIGRCVVAMTMYFFLLLVNIFIIVFDPTAIKILHTCSGITLVLIILDEAMTISTLEQLKFTQGSDFYYD
ncbi:MAG: hypothetical protein [Bacteriophage sp.]|nr:MAG: hypothetical protein [Bacteriophage sp.]